MPASFVDSNVILYFASGDASKADRAGELLRLPAVISVQVLNEVAAVCTRKFRYSWPQVENVLALLKHERQVEPISLATHELGIEIAERHRLRVYDAMLIASALLADCATLWSEDMQDGLVVDGRLTIRNPFSGVN